MANLKPTVLNPAGYQEQLRSTDHLLVEATPNQNTHAANKQFVDGEVVTLNTTITNEVNTLNQTITTQIAGVNTTISNLTKADVGLPNVDNTSDANKPISTAVQNALNSLTKTDVGLANVTIAGVDKPVSTAQQSALNGKADLVVWCRHPSSPVSL